MYSWLWRGDRHVGTRAEGAVPSGRLAHLRRREVVEGIDVVCHGLCTSSGVRRHSDTTKVVVRILKRGCEAIMSERQLARDTVGLG